MNIGIDALGRISDDTGGQTYLVNLSKALQTIDPKHRFIYFVGKGQGEILRLKGDKFAMVEIPYSLSTFGRIFCEHLVLPYYTRKYKIEVMYFPSNFASYYCPVPYTLAIRSMLIYNMPHEVDRLRSWYRHLVFPYSARQASRILTPSGHTKSEIVETFSLNETKVSVIPHGIDLDLFGSDRNSGEATAIFAKYKIRQPYILNVSALWEYKNQDKLIHAFNSLIQQKQDQGCELVLIGRGATAFESYTATLHRLVADLKLDDRVRFVDFVPHDELRHIYQNAEVFAFPSMTESFGHPLFEAMAAGVPVVCSNRHGLPQLVGESALLIDPLNIGQFAAALSRLLLDTNLKNSLIREGKQKAQSLSWTTCAEKTLSLIESSHH